MFSPVFTASVQLWLPTRTDSLTDLLHVWGGTKTRRPQEVEEAPGCRLLSLTWGQVSLPFVTDYFPGTRWSEETLVRNTLGSPGRVCADRESERATSSLYNTDLSHGVLKVLKLLCVHLFSMSGFPPVTLLRTAQLGTCTECANIQETRWISLTLFILSTLLTCLYLFSIAADLRLEGWRADEASQLSQGDGRLHPGWVASSPLAHRDTNRHPHSHAHQQTIYSSQKLNGPWKHLWTDGGLRDFCFLCINNWFGSNKTDGKPSIYINLRSNTTLFDSSQQ